MMAQRSQQAISPCGASPPGNPLLWPFWRSAADRLGMGIDAGACSHPGLTCIGLIFCSGAEAGGTILPSDTTRIAWTSCAGQGQGDGTWPRADVKPSRTGQVYRPCPSWPRAGGCHTIQDRLVVQASSQAKQASGGRP